MIWKSNVLDVTSHISDINSYTAEMRVRQEFRDKVFDYLMNKL
jgi:hypothetical protein